VCAVDWTQVISELTARGWKQSRIAERIGVSQPTISALANGQSKSTSFEIGVALIALHAEAIRQPIEPAEPEQSAA
jgi:transcriptional regulator with XRE-family HTH domain